MKNKKLILFAIIASTASIFSLLSLPSTAITIHDIAQPKPICGKLGADLQVENKIIIQKSNALTFKDAQKILNEQVDYSKFTYADLSLKHLANELSQELDASREDIMEDVKTLWIGAAQRSETISYAIYKLSKQDNQNNSTKDTVVKKIIRPLAGLSSAAGMGLGDPIIATSAIVSGNLLGAFSVTDKEENSAFTKVSDTDMVILVRKIDDLQRALTEKYCDYVISRNVLKRAIQLTDRRKVATNKNLYSSPEQILIADAYYREALNFENQKQFEFINNRAALQQIVGEEALKDFELILENRGE